MLTETQKYCTRCGDEIVWDEIKTAFFEPRGGQPRFYIRGECPARKLNFVTGHSFGLVSQPGQFGLFPRSYGIMDEHPAIPAYLEREQVGDGE